MTTHKAVPEEGRLRILTVPEANAKQASFMVLHDGRIYFEGSAAELRVSRDDYLRQFGFMTLPPW